MFRDNIVRPIDKKESAVKPVDHKAERHLINSLLLLSAKNSYPPAIKDGKILKP